MTDCACLQLGSPGMASSQARLEAMWNMSTLPSRVEWWTTFQP